MTLREWPASGQPELPMDIVPLLKTYSEKIEELLQEEIPPQSVDFLSEWVWYQFSSGGKRLRPALCLLTCEQLGGEVELAYPFALASEMLHNLLLIHDDIEDGDEQRRDRPTLWVKEGQANAINVGDYLCPRAYALILRSKLPPETVLKLVDIFTLTFQKTVEGQALDINLRGSESFNLEQYYRIVQHKTAYYLTFNIVGGALIAGGISDEGIEKMWDLGRCLGPAFQIRDDIIDLTEGKGRGGEIGCDIKEGKPSVFYAYCLEQLSSDDPRRERLIEIIRKDRTETDSQLIQEVIDIFREVGAFEFADQECQKLIEQAEGILDDLPLSSEGQELFRAIGRFMIDRTK